jgi:hypothetical protein
MIWGKTLLGWRPEVVAYLPEWVVNVSIVAGFLFHVSIGLWMLAFVEAVPELIRRKVLSGMKGGQSE